MNKFLVFAVLATAIGLLFSCTSDIESAEDVLKKSESSSSDGSLSSTVQGVSSGGSSQSGLVFCDLVGGGCRELPEAACLRFGQVVESCPETGSSSSTHPSSSSQSGSVLCDLGGDCREFSYDVCLAFGQVVESCPGIALSSSSPAPPSSDSPVPSSSSSLPSETVLCEYSGNCLLVSADVCAAIGGIAVRFCSESSSSVPPSSSSIVPSSNSVVTNPSSNSGGGTSSNSGRVQYCNWGRCEEGRGWECMSGGCYELNSDDLTASDCTSKSGEIVDCCPAGTAPPGANFPACSGSSGGRYCDWGRCEDGSGWECMSGGCYELNNDDLTASDCTSKSGRIVSCCPIANRPPSANFPSCY